MRVVSTPYTPNAPIMAAPLAEWDKPPRGLSGRDTLLFSSTKCMPYDDGNVGKRMRYELALAFNSSADDVAVSCTDLPVSLGDRGKFAKQNNVVSEPCICLDHLVPCLFWPLFSKTLKIVS